MLIEAPERFEQYGSVRIYDVSKVLELDSLASHNPSGTYKLDYNELEDIGSRTAIVVPVKDEELFTLEGVLAGIPHLSPIILISASSRLPIDRYRHELALSKNFYYRTSRPIIVIHQRDPVWSEFLAGTPLEELLDENGIVRKGKGEGMILGVMVAKYLGYEYVGFIDSDNYVPGSVHEYAWTYYAGFAIAESKGSMIRIQWPYKAKLQESEVYLRRRGRVSRVTNTVINHVLTMIRRIETDVIKTANSGEHALSMDLAVDLRWAGGFAVEPFEYVYLLEKCWIEKDENECPMIKEGVKIIQLESRNPHIHASRDDGHLIEMLALSLGTIYHSKLVNGGLKEYVINTLRNYGYTGKEPPKPRVYPPIKSVDIDKIVSHVLSESIDARIYGLKT
ncbi:MAG: mannosyl-3-phosphoglycerate synthase [Desulfurococcales archaeon]|nr:mannosyl-3-phosphoglycerate synthase [Desulfurococcales archaeon]